MCLQVVDFGCAECKFLSLLIQCQQMTEIYGVDIDGSLLQRNSFKMQPRACDYLHPRELGLKCCLLAGSVADYDARLRHVDAVTLIELCVPVSPVVSINLLFCLTVQLPCSIEHLELPELEAFPGNVFGQLKPRLVVVTTPNSEFNVLFPNCTGFRHYDHKFEWTRQQFQEW